MVKRDADLESHESISEIDGAGWRLSAAAAVNRDLNVFYVEIVAGTEYLVGRIRDGRTFLTKVDSLLSASFLVLPNDDEVGSAKTDP